MARTRALLTKTEREQITGGDTVDESKRYQAISRVRGRIQDELSEDVEVLKQSHPELYHELQEIVCDESAEQSSG